MLFAIFPWGFINLSTAGGLLLNIGKKRGNRGLHFRFFVLECILVKIGYFIKKTLTS